MGFPNQSELHSGSSMMISNNNKVIALESSLQESIVKFNDLVLDLEQLYIDSETYKHQYQTVKDNCENKICKGAEELKKVIETKNHIIQCIASTLTKLDETKNFDILQDAFKILFEEPLLTPPADDLPNPSNCYPTRKKSSKSPVNKNQSPVNSSKIIKKEVDVSITEDVPFNEESVCEIEGTPTGRTSPIIHGKKVKSTLGKSAASDFRDKKKCAGDWPTPDNKSLKLTFPTCSTPTGKAKGTGKLRQSRINLMKMKQTFVVDLTCSPETLEQSNKKTSVQPLIKKESIENDDTILPSPTSGPNNFALAIPLKTTSKASPVKFKKPPLSLKNKSEQIIKQNENKNITNIENDKMDQSINILHQLNIRLRNNIKKENVGPVKMEVDSDATHCDDMNANVSSPLQRRDDAKQCSPSKQALAENMNIVNTPPKNQAESSMSILRPEVMPAAVEHARRKIPEPVEHIYKEPAARSKAEKRNLQGWSCEECKNFYGILYKDDPVMLQRKINECSKHRGRHNPARPSTPPNFWNPRWTVPDDTEELNRMNNAT